MGHNIDVTPASPTTYDHHVTSEPQHVRENQNGGNVWCIVHQNIIRYIPLDIYTYVDI